MIGTVRTFSIDVRNDIARRMQATASNIAEATGATATVRFKDLSKPTSADEYSIPPVVNDAAVTAAALPVFERLVGKDNVRQISLQTTADDYSFFGQQVPSLYFWIGITPPRPRPAEGRVQSLAAVLSRRGRHDHRRPRTARAHDGVLGEVESRLLRSAKRDRMPPWQRHLRRAAQNVRRPAVPSSSSWRGSLPSLPCPSSASSRCCSSMPRVATSLMRPTKRAASPMKPQRAANASSATFAPRSKRSRSGRWCARWTLRNCDPALPTLRELYPRAGNIIVVDAEGWILCGAKPPPGGERLRVVDMELQRAVMRDGGFRLSQPLIGKISKTWGVTAVQRGPRRRWQRRGRRRNGDRPAASAALRHLRDRKTSSPGSSLARAS